MFCRGPSSSFAAASSQPSHLRHQATTFFPFSPNSLARLGQPVASLPASTFSTVGSTTSTRLLGSSSPAPSATARMKTSISSDDQPDRASPPARARAASCLAPWSGQYRASREAAASFPTARISSLALTRAGSPSLSHWYCSPLGWTEGGTTVCWPVDRNSTKTVPSSSPLKKSLDSVGILGSTRVPLLRGPYGVGQTYPQAARVVAGYHR